MPSPLLPPSHLPPSFSPPLLSSLHPLSPSPSSSLSRRPSSLPPHPPPAEPAAGWHHGRLCSFSDREQSASPPPPRCSARRMRRGRGTGRGTDHPSTLPLSSDLMDDWPGGEPALSSFPPPSQLLHLLLLQLWVALIVI